MKVTIKIAGRFKKYSKFTNQNFNIGVFNGPTALDKYKHYKKSNV
jgi:hypothetical protein